MLAGPKLFAQKVSQEEIEKAKQAYKDYMNKSGKTKTKLDIKPVSVPAIPPGIDPELNKATPSSSDQTYCKVHMKLANRHFKTANYTRALQELDLVFDVIPNHAAARFMRAVIAARQSDLLNAWFNIQLAQDGQPENDLIKEFIKRLETVLPRPSNPPWVNGICRPIPSHASELAVDLLERIFIDSVSKNINTVSFEPHSSDSGKSWAVLILEGSGTIDEKALQSLLKTVVNGEVRIQDIQKEGKSVKLLIELPAMPMNNPSPKPAAALQEFIKSVADETDTAVQESSEQSLESSESTDIVFSVSARTISQLNNFLRKISPYTFRYLVDKIQLAYLGDQVIWRGSISASFKPE